MRESTARALREAKSLSARTRMPKNSGITKPNGKGAIRVEAQVGEGKAAKDQILIRPLRQRTVEFRITGTSPYMQAKFSEKARNKLMEQHKAGSTGRKNKVREARDFEADCEAAKHKFSDGTCGIPATAFRRALISACRTVGFAMTAAKLAIFIQADGSDALDGTPLVRIEGEPEMNISPVRNASGVIDLRSRPLWREWACNLRVRFDTDVFTLNDVANLVFRAGALVGVGEGRPDSKDSCGLGFGTFEIDDDSLAGVTQE